MANENEISIEMRLRMEKLKADAQKAAKEVNDGLASSVKGLPKSSTEIDEENKARRERIARARRNAALDAADMAKEQKAAKIAARQAAIQSQNEIDAAIEAAARRNRARKLIRERQEERNNRSLQGPDLEGKVRAKAAGENESKSERSGIGALALKIAAVIISFESLKRIIGNLNSEIDRARKIYANSLSSGGLSTNFIIKRQQLSEVLGVGENEVFQYGRAIEAINSKLEWSRNILAQTNPTLTALGWHTKITEQNLHALWASMANDAAPAIEKVLNAIDKLAQKGTTLSHDLIEWPLKILRAQKFANSFASGDALSEQHDDKTGKIWFSPKKGNFQFSEKMQQELQNAFEKFNKANLVKPTPEVQAYMKQTPVSTFERQGLVVGGGGGVNYQSQIARNTEKTANAIKELSFRLLQPVGLQIGLASMP